MIKIPYRLKNISGIYAIRDLINNRIYIGSTIDLYTRICRHRSSLRKNKHYNPEFQESFNNNSEINFLVEVLEFCDSSVLLINEQKFMDYYRSLDANMIYSRRIHCDTNLNIKFSEEAKEKISKSKTGKKLSYEHRMKYSKSHMKFGTPVLQYTLDGKFINEYGAIKVAARETNICGNSIR